jgi:hypothetical protein
MNGRDHIDQDPLGIRAALAEYLGKMSTLQRRPSIADLARRFHCNRQTITKALANISKQPPPGAKAEAQPAAPAPGSAQNEADAMRLEAERLRHAIEVTRLKRELEALQLGKTPDKNGESKPSELADLVKALAPVVSPFLSSYIESARRRDELLERALSRLDQPPMQQDRPAQNALADIDKNIEMFRKLIDVGKELGGERDSMSALVDIARDLVTQKLREGSPGEERPGLNTPSSRASLSPETSGAPREDPMRGRVRSFVQVVLRELEAQTDPVAVVDELEHAAGLLPGPVRQALLNDSPENFGQTLVRWLPELELGQLGQVLQNTEKRAWLETFLAELRAPEPEEEEVPVDAE